MDSQKLNTKLINSAVGPDGLSTRDGQKSSPVEGAPGQSKKIMVASALFMGQSVSTVTSLPEGVTSVPEGVELTRAMSPVVSLGPLTAEIDFALQQVNTNLVFEIHILMLCSI